MFHEALHKPASIPRVPMDSKCPDRQSEKDISRVIRNVVVIKFSHTLPFDGDVAGASEATGFVVDATRGYILTNRHVAGPGPFWGLCIFDQEAASCQPLYIDPVHDFAFLKYDPEGIRNIDIDGLDLNPDKASVGQPVLVVGNDAGEATSIIDGTISRIDRNAPEYDEPYSDFNINYYQANMNLSGGISGSPALGEDGLVLGMVSGGRTDGAICYLLPTGPVLKTLRRLRQGHDIPRGDIQCQFTLTPLHKCKGLGLDSSWESRLRQQIADSGGLLVANKILPNGPSSGKIIPGDILLEVGGAVILRFDELEDIFNENVGDQVSVSLLRSGALILAIVDVVNLHHITPKRLVSLGGLFYCHDLSYVQAIKYSVPASGVYVAESCEPLMVGDGEPGWIIKRLNGQDVHNLEGFLSHLKTFYQGQSVALTYAHLESLHQRRTSVITFDLPHGITVLSQDGPTGAWRSATTSLHQNVRPAVTRTLFSNRISPRARLPAVLPNLVHVESRAYLHLDGFPTMLARGMGVIVDAAAGLAVVSRQIVPHKACYITITLGSSIEVEARCLFLHAHHCYAIIQYDVSLAPTHIRGVKLGDRRLYSGSEASLIYFARPERLLQGDAIARPVVVTGLTLRPSTSYLSTHPVNADLIGIDAPSEVKRTDGVVVSSDGSIQAIWMPDIGGLAVVGISTVLSRLRRDSVAALHVMPAAVEVVSTRHARIMGAPEEFIRSVEESTYRSHIFKVKRTFSNLLKEDDIFMAVDEKQAEWADFDMLDPRTRSVRVWRQNAAHDLELPSIRVDNLETTRCVEFCGACIQPTPLAIRHALDLDHGQAPRETYITHVRAGSTGDLLSLPAEAFITKINGTAVRDFEAFVAMAKALPRDRGFTVTTVTVSGSESICVLQSNTEHHPFVEWAFDGTKFVNQC